MAARAARRMVFGQRRKRAVDGSATVAAVACFVDFELTPHRLTPGYEMRLSRTSLLAVYSAFAVGLAITCAMRRCR